MIYSFDTKDKPALSQVGSKAQSLIKDGDLISVDGSRGVARILENSGFRLKIAYVRLNQTYEGAIRYILRKRSGKLLN